MTEKPNLQMPTAQHLPTRHINAGKTKKKTDPRHSRNRSPEKNLESKAAGQQSTGNGHQSSFNTSKNAFCGTSTLPIWRIFFLPFFCFSSNLRFREISPP